MRRRVLWAYSALISGVFWGAGTAQAVPICLDPGHGGTDPGACGCNLEEAAVVLKSTKMLKTMLEAAGHTVYMTRTTDTGVGLSARASYANSKGVTTFASIHTNSYNSESTGIETYCYTAGLSTRSGTQAKNIQAKMVATWPLRDRGAKEANFAVVRETSMPATLSELAFISNCNKDAKYLADDAQLRRAMVAHCEALVSQWGGTASKCSDSGSSGDNPGGSTAAKGTIKGGTFNTTIAQANWLSGVTYTVGGQSQTSSGSYAMMSFSLDPGNYTATAKKDGWNTATKDCGAVTSGNVTWCSIALTEKPATIKPGTATGHVNNASTGAHIANAKVTIKNGSSVVYDGTKKWSFSVNPGTYQIVASADGYDDNEIGCTVTAEKETDCTLTLVPKKGTITGAVSDGTQNIAATVAIGESRLEYDGNADFKFTVEAGTYTINASAAGYAPASVTCTVEAGKEAVCNITVQKEQIATERGTLMGLVRDAKTGANVESDVTAGSQSVHFSGNDYYRFYLEAGDYTVTAQSAGYETGSQSCKVESGQTVRCDIEIMPHGGAFAGTLLDAVTKQPIDSTRNPSVKIGDDTMAVDATGAWISSSHDAGYYDVVASAEGYNISTVSCAIQPGSKQSPCNILLVPSNVKTGVLQGYVYDSRSQTMRIAATVTIEGYNPARYPGKGTWRMSNLPAGYYNVKATSDGYYEATKVCQVMPSDDEKEYSQCNIGLLAKSGGGDVVEADYDSPTTKIQPYSESCSATPFAPQSQSWAAWALGIMAIAGLGIRKRQSKGDIR